MNSMEKEIVIHRLLAGKTRVNLDGQRYIVTLPSSFDHYIAQEIYQETYEIAKSEGILCADDIIGFLLLQRLWDADHEHRLSTIKDDLDNFKIRLYKSEFRPNETLIARKLLQNCKDEMYSLFARKHQYDYMTAEGLAGLARSTYLLGANICDSRGRPLWEDGEFWEDGDDGIISQIMFLIRDQSVDDNTLRDISRTEPWRTYWISSNRQPFKGTVGDYSDEQRSLIMWSRLYDSILEHPEKPSEAVLRDNDMVDGWLLTQQEERKEKQLQYDAQKRLSNNKKINNAEHVFIMTNDIYRQHGKDNPTLQSLQEVGPLADSLNTPAAKMVQQERFAVIKAVGEISGTMLPDVQRDLRMKAQQQAMQNAKGK